MSTHVPQSSLPEILLTGFGPFLSHSVNPSREAALSIAAQSQARCRITPWILPVTYAACREFAENITFLHRFHLIIMLGVRTGGNSLDLEQCARNIEHCGNPDMSGDIARDRSICTNGPDTVSSRLPVHRIIGELTNRDIPCRVSNSAGTYVCNSLFYRVQRACLNTPVLSGFVHLPPTGEQWTTARIQTAIQCVIDASVDAYHDL